MKFTIKKQGNATLTVNCYVKIDNQYISTTNISSTITDDGRVVINIPKGTSLGTYRVEFVYGSSKFVYNLIVK